MINDGNKFETLYDTYSQMICSIIIQISPTQTEAEDLLISVFTKAHQQGIANQKYPSQCIALILLTIKTAHEQLSFSKDYPNFKLKYFEHSPILHSLLCKKGGIENYCAETKLSKTDTAKMLHKEFILFRELSTQEKKSLLQESIV